MSGEGKPPRPPIVRRSAGDRVRQAVTVLAEHHGQVITHTEKAWASITFAGTRHTLTVIFEGDDAVAAGEDFLAALPDHEFTIPRQLVADATVREVRHVVLPTPRMTVVCELLLLEES